MKHLHEEGYVVVADVITPDEVIAAREMFIGLIEKLYEIDRADVTTWKKWPLDRRGIDLTPSIMQSEGAWYIRSHANVKRAFRTIWKEELDGEQSASEVKEQKEEQEDEEGEDNSLIVSMDSVLMWRPWWVNEDWYPHTEGLHVDQNLLTSPHFECVQGMMPLFDVTPEIGGLEVVPRTHTKESLEFFKERYKARFGRFADNFIPLPRDDPRQDTGHLVLSHAGDLILWDSRTIHGGRVGSADTLHPPPSLSPCLLARLAVTVCMVPRKRASESVLKRRREGFQKGFGYNHMPWEARVTARPFSSFSPISLSPSQLALL